MALPTALTSTSNPCHYRIKGTDHLLIEHVKGCLGSGRLGTQHHINAFGQMTFMAARQHTETTFDAIADNGVAHCLGHSQTKAPIMRRHMSVRCGTITHCIMHDEIPTGNLATPLEHGDKIAVAFQPFHGDDAVGINQAARFRRPLARRRLMTARPERVRMRKRNPCFI